MPIALTGFTALSVLTAITLLTLRATAAVTTLYAPIMFDISQSLSTVTLVVAILCTDKFYTAK